MSRLKISADLALPLEAVTQTFAILAKRGAGKTTTALVMVEEMLKAAAQVVVADPVGVTWGLRAAANGRDPGLPIIVMGGDHGDVPLEAAAGKIIAEFVVDTGQSVVRDLARYWIGELGQSGAARMLQALVDAYPRAMTAEELGRAAAISEASGTFDTYLGRLRRLELVTGPRSELRASEEFVA